MMFTLWGVRAVVLSTCVAALTAFAKDRADGPIDKKCDKESGVKIECPGKDCPGGKPQDCARPPSKPMKEAAKKAEARGGTAEKATAKEKKGDDAKQGTKKQEAKQ